MSLVTLDLLKQMCGKTKSSTLEKFVEPLNTVGTYYNLFDNTKRMAAFLAQVAHESGNFVYTKENLNYSQSALRKVFKKYFPTDASTQGYARNPEKIANKVYANRMGNGPESSGDGWKYRGRGLIQLTGKNNYTLIAKSLNRFMDETISYLETTEGAVSSAAWFWDINKLSIYADNDDFINLTRRINGGTNGLEDRLHHYHIALNALGTNK